MTTQGGIHVRELEAALAEFASMIVERGPTVREYQARLGLSSSSVATYRLEQLRRRGWIERTGAYRHRNYRLTDAGRQALADGRDSQ